MGQPVAGFLPLKTPRTTPPDDESMFDVSMFVERQQSLVRSVGLCINLCGGKAKAAETYDTAEWDQWDVAYKAIACADEAVPAEEAVDAFVAAVGSLWSDPLKRKLYVAVHCATGFNVTGYMICRYLMRVGAVELPQLGGLKRLRSRLLDQGTIQLDHVGRRLRAHGRALKQPREEGRCRRGAPRGRGDHRATDRRRH